MERKTNLIEMLQYVSPDVLLYAEWVEVGMALKHEGYGVDVWDTWSKRDINRYKPGLCLKKWKSFTGAAKPVTGGTIAQMAMNNGWSPPRAEGHEIGWDDTIGEIGDKLIDTGFLEPQEIAEPADADWGQADELATYIRTLFEPNENVGYVTECWKSDDGKYMPKAGSCDRTAGELLKLLANCGTDIGAVIGDCTREAGAWIRFNPLDGKGVKNENVADFRYALVESDSMAIAMQYAILLKMELPIACLVHSGKKSLHAIVRVEADTIEEYRKRVNYLYDKCKASGLAIDQQNKNPSRLSRMPGIWRDKKKQFLVATNIGKLTWQDWVDHIEEIGNDLPDMENLASVWNNMPELAPPLIEGILRQGHKMLMAGPSKAGKSYALIQLCIAIAEGGRWMGWKCAQGRVLYVNLELDRSSCLHRFRDVYGALRLVPDHVGNIDIWNLRGNAVPMDKLEPKLVRRAARAGYIAIVIDPIYKVITGDENSADQMAHFCNQFDKIATKLGAAVIYCHHHSKGYQGGKRSMDRASGSGVFARDPDVLLDMTELDTADAGIECGSRTAWRLEGTLREFPRFEPVSIWFDYPIHVVDCHGELCEARPEADKPGWKKSAETRSDPETRQAIRNGELDMVFESCAASGPVTVRILAEAMDCSEKTIKRHIKQHGGFDIVQGEENRPSEVRRKG